MALNVSGAVRYHYGKFPPKGPSIESLIHELLEATDALSRYDQMLRRMRNSEVLLAPLRSQEAVISSRMEGTVSTVDEVLRYEAETDSDDSRANQYRSDVFETVLYQRTLKRAQQAITEGFPFSTSLIKMMHQQLLSYGRGARKSPGQFKQEQNFLADGIQKIGFIPASPEKLQEGMEAWLDYLQNSPDPVLVKTAIMHLEFEALHPFQDGNGRIGRMLITLYLWHSNLISAPYFYISGFLETHKDEYIAAMRAVSQDGSWEAWCRFFLKAVSAQAKQNLATAEKIEALYEELKPLFTEILSSKWSVHALDFLFRNPHFRNNKFTSESGIPAAIASRFTRALLQHHVIVPVQEAAGRRPALYSFEPLMKLVRA